MRRITVSVLTLLMALPAMADARLPVVSLAAGSVSARAAFGEDIVKSTAPVAPVVTPIEPVAPVAVAPTRRAVEKSESTENKRIVARGTVRKSTSTRTAATDRGEQIVASNDVLTPRRPSADLWAHSDAPLRMPDASEFSVIRSDYDLPEESLDRATAGRSAKPAIVARNDAHTASRADATPMADIDNQIARLVELQRRADDSVASAPTRVIAAPIADMPDSAPVAPTRVAHADASAITAPADDVKLSRMVVPMAPSAVVRTVEKNTSPRIAAVRDDMTKMTPGELRKAFRKTFLSENKHLSTFQIDDRFDVASDMSGSIEGFTAKRDLSEAGGIRPLEIKIRFRNEDSALSRDNFNLLSEYASIVVSNPKRAIQVAIPQRATRNADDRKLAARRLAIVEQVLRDTGVAEHRIVPVLSQRDEEGFVLRIISNDQYETLTQKQRDMFGDTISKKTYKSMSW